jgi:hypothetical protein
MNLCIVASFFVTRLSEACRVRESLPNVVESVGVGVDGGEDVEVRSWLG